MDEPCVTVVIPTKDRPGLLRDTLRSVLAQREVALKVVVVDDGSLTPVEQPSDPRVRVLRHDAPRGVSAARNAGLSTVDTPWTAFVDDDDLWSPWKLHRQLEALSADPERLWACSTAAHFSADAVALHRVSDEVDLSALLHANAVPGGGSGVLVRTSTLHELGGFDERLSILADWDCWIRLSTRSSAATVPDPDVGYRVHSTSMAHDVRRSEEEMLVLRRKHAGLSTREGVELDIEGWDAYLESMAYRAGDWRTGARLTITLFARHGHRRAPLRALGRLRPRPMARRRLNRSRRPEVHAVDVASARAWLSAYDALPHPSGVFARQCGA